MEKHVFKLKQLTFDVIQNNFIMLFVKLHLKLCKQRMTTCNILQKESDVSINSSFK